MKELVGKCTVCEKEVYCLDGFFNGIFTDEKKIFCFECCEEEKAREKTSPQN